MGLTKVTYAMIEGAAINVLDYGAVGDGTANDTSALQSALTAAAASGQTLYIPSGTYLISNQISLDLQSSDKSVSVFCEPSTVIKGSSSFPNTAKMILVNATAGQHSFKWVGGTIDGRLRPATGGGAPDQLYIASELIDRVYIDNVYFLNNDTRSGTAGDSCLFIAGSDDVNVTNCVFQGAIDSGFYLSGDATETYGKRCYVAGNTFIECENGFITKRSYEYHVINGNFFTKCNNACVVGGEADTTLLPGKKAVISNNNVDNVVFGLQLRISNGSIVSNNRIEDYGIDKTNTPVAGRAIIISGSNNCIVSSNYCGFTGAFVPNATAYAILINQRIYNAVTYTSDYTLVTGNSFFNTPYAVYEDTGADYSIISNNILDGVTTPYRIVGANTNYGQNQTLKGVDPYLLIQDTESTVALANAKVRLAESDGSGAIDNYWDVHYDGTTLRGALTFAANGVKHFMVNGDAVSVNFIPTTEPTPHSAGDVYYDSGTNKLRCWNGSSWNDLF
jgi:hypothetical protein